MSARGRARVAVGDAVLEGELDQATLEAMERGDGIRAPDDETLRGAEAASLAEMLATARAAVAGERDAGTDARAFAHCLIVADGLEAQATLGRLGPGGRALLGPLRATALAALHRREGDPEARAPHLWATFGSTVNGMRVAHSVRAGDLEAAWRANGTPRAAPPAHWRDRLLLFLPLSEAAGERAEAVLAAREARAGGAVH